MSRDRRPDGKERVGRGEYRAMISAWRYQLDEAAGVAS